MDRLKIVADSTAGRAVLVGLLALACYGNSFPGAFIADDIPIVRDNPLVVAPSAGRIFVADYWGEGVGSGLHRPLTILSYAINRRLLGTSAAAFHAVNVLLHAGASALVPATLVACGIPGGVSLAAAALFAAHPVHTEVVDIVTGRAELLAALFALLALFAAQRRGRGHRMACLAWFALGLLSKESAATFPLLLLAVDAFRARGFRQVVRERLPLYLSLLLLAAAWFVFRRWGLPSGALPANAIYPVDNPLVLLGPVARFLTLLKVQWLYLTRLAVPLELNAVFVDTMIGPVRDLFDARGLALLSGFGVLVAATVAGWHRREPWSLGVVLYFLAFLATGNVLVLTTFLVAERFAYLPSAWFCLAAAAGAAALLRRASSGVSVPCAATLAVVAVTLLGARTLERNRDFTTPLALWSAEVRSEPTNVRALMLLAGARLDAGEPGGAEEVLRRALALRPDFVETRLALGFLLLDHGRPGEAARVFEGVIAGVSGESPLAMTGMARAFLALGMTREAAAWTAAIPDYFRHQSLFRDLERRVREADSPTLRRDSR